MFLIFIYFISHIKFDIFIFIFKEPLHLAKTVIDVQHFKLKMVQFIFINLLPMQMRLRHIIWFFKSAQPQNNILVKYGKSSLWTDWEYIGRENLESPFNSKLGFFLIGWPICRVQSGLSEELWIKLWAQLFTSLKEVSQSRKSQV